MDTARESYLAAAAATAELVQRIDRGWERPGLGDWDLRALVGHTSRALITVLTYLDRTTATATLATSEAYYATLAETPVDPTDVTARGVAAGAALGPDPGGEFANLVHRVTAKLATTDDETPIETIAGSIRVGPYLVTRNFELIVHGFDIARAAGLPFAPPGESLAQACALAGRIAAFTGRAELLLMAVTGRQQLPAAFSVV